MIPDKGYPIAITDPNGHVKRFIADTSFEPYRREAFRHRDIPSGRESVAITNIPGEGTVNTEGLWRREQIDWTQGAGQMYLDRKKESQSNRFFTSKGVDVFTLPLQATLLADTYRKDSGTVDGSLKVARCGDYVIASTNAGVTRYDQYWNAVTAQWGTTYGGSSPTQIRDITTNDSYVYIATNTGIWFCNPANLVSGHIVFQLYAANDTTTGYGEGYDMVSWANDQLLASSHQDFTNGYLGNRLYAFQPRTATSAPEFGMAPAVAAIDLTITSISNSAGTATVLCLGGGCSQLQVGQKITLAGVTAYSAAASGYGGSLSLSGQTVTVTPATGQDPGFQVGDSIVVTDYFTGVPSGRTETVTVTVASGTSYEFVSTKFSTRALATGWTYTVANGNNSPYNGTFTVASIISDTEFTISAPLSYGFSALGSTDASATNDLPPDVLFTHDNPNFVWSSATGGETQIYVGGYVKSPNGNGYSGCVYRSDLLGSSTTSATGTSLISNSVVAQPWALDTPVQALPLSPDEFPLCVKSYLNYIFVGTNRGIRMCQTLSIYDPTATATGDLKSGPLIPNILQPVGPSGVTAIVGDGRYVWFAWNNYDGVSTGLGKMNLQEFIEGDPLAPVYASDIMVTGQGVINSLDWDPTTNTPLMAVASLGIYGPYATNDGGIPAVSKYVASGTITSGIFDYGISDEKIPVFFDYGVITPSTTYAQAFVSFDPNDPNGAGTQTLPSYAWGPDTSKEVNLFSTPYARGDQFSVEIQLFSDSTQTYTPTLYRWTLRSWPAVVAGTNIMLVVQSFSVNDVDGGETFADPYEFFIWFENLRQSQGIVTYSEGPLSVQAIVSVKDWLPHKERDTYEGGYEGDLIVTLTTIDQYVYTKPRTS